MGGYLSTPEQAEELGTIEYVNLDKALRHGDMEKALAIAKETGKPLFCNFVEWEGCQGCKDAGKIFSDLRIKRVAEELFVPCAFNTWDRFEDDYNEPMKRWGGRLRLSDGGYLRIVDSEGENVIAETRGLNGIESFDEVRDTIVEALKTLGKEVPDYMP